MDPTTQTICCSAQDSNSLKEARFIATKRKLWRFREPEIQAECQIFIKERCGDVTPCCVEDAWNNLKDCHVGGVDEACGKTRDDKNKLGSNNKCGQD